MGANITRGVEWVLMESLTIIRHGESLLNSLADTQADNTLYQDFTAAYAAAPHSPHTQMLAREYMASMADDTPDSEIPLSEQGKCQVLTTAHTLAEHDQLPDVVYVSPFRRTMETYEELCNGWHALQKVEHHIDTRLTERDRGVVDRYKSWKAFYSLNPEELSECEQRGPYWYRFPEGESLADVKHRSADILLEWSTKHEGQRVLAIAHVGAILAMREVIEGYTPDELLDIHTNHRPRNASVTQFTRVAGKLSLTMYDNDQIA